MLISSIDSYAVAASIQHAGLVDSSQGRASQLPRVQPRFRAERAVLRSSSTRTSPFSIAPPAVMLVDRAQLVSLRDDIDHSWTGSADHRFLRARDASQDDASLFDDDPGYLSADNPLICAGLILLLSAALGLAGSWLLGRPMRNLATSFCAVASDSRVRHGITEKGPKRLRDLARTFDEMLTRRCHASAQQSATLAALAKDLEAHAVRLRGTALQINEWHKRVALVEDVDLFSHIATQFVEAGGCTTTPESDIPVDAFIRDRFVLTSSLDASLFNSTLDAGADFLLPRTFLERVMSNLVDNALEHGVPPIEIKTSRTRDEWTLSFRDHGAGIKQSELSSATSTFVRLGSPDKHDDGRHWGLGLALVKKLVADAGGRLILGNHPEGGLFVRMVFSATKNAADGQA
ncbi:Histidine kinase-, DNA gyrase B-, and HSP90-like ATPase [Paraburkholderia fungorum]|uniref:histidine kinase n=1 Tax=Paraburkholderia fungorum TaxID=134537 RepID=A0A1H1HTS6_9BURK|nr:Histidine kinase-, DNA gyrase B-, and HSP90-like ATPase [Paraburkholderia fungorum]